MSTHSNCLAGGLSLPCRRGKFQTLICSHVRERPHCRHTERILHHLEFLELCGLALRILSFPGTPVSLREKEVHLWTCWPEAGGCCQFRDSYFKIVRA